MKPPSSKYHWSHETVSTGLRRNRVAIAVSAILVLSLITLAIDRARLSNPIITPTGASLGRSRGGVPVSELNLLVITLDTTRADRLGAYGWPDSATPVLDRLAHEGTIFEHAVAPAPLTLPAHSSLFTGAYPFTHGVRDNGGFYLDERAVTLAERLRDVHFATGGFVASYVLDRRWGIAQGFDTYFDNFDGPAKASIPKASIKRPGNEVADRALEWLKAVGANRFFGWVHFYDPHVPYEPPEPYRSQFAEQPYQGELAFVDSQIGRILRLLEERNLLRKTIVVVIGDHGESLGEHGENTHGFFIYDSVVRVPFMILAPFDSVRARRVTDSVRSIDMMPTVLDMLGIRMGAPEEVEGRSLVPLMTGAAREMGLTAYSEAVYPRYHYGWSELRAITAGRFKYIDAPRPELYDLEHDPGEAHNLYDSRRSLAGRLAEEVRGLRKRSNTSTKAPVDVDPEARARLAALGYIGTFVPASVGLDAPLPDPKDKVGLFNLLITAREQLEDAGSSYQAIDSLREVVAKDANIVDAWLLMGNALERRRIYPAALDSYKRALALNPNYDLALTYLATLYRTLGRDADALVAYQHLAEVDPKNALAHQRRAEILLEHGELLTAERELDAALALEPAMAAARNTLGALRLRQGDIDAGEREIHAALRQAPDLHLAHFNLAIAAEQRGDVSTAIAEYQKEIALEPSSYMAQFNVGKLYERIGDRASQIKSYKDAIASNPRFAAGYLFLAKAYFDAGQQLDDAARLAQRGIELAPRDEWAPLGHFVLSDVYAREGRTAEAEREVAAGRLLESRLKHQRD